jgi:hypothetical protein
LKEPQRGLRKKKAKEPHFRKQGQHDLPELAKEVKEVRKEQVLVAILQAKEDSNQNSKPTEPKKHLKEDLLQEMLRQVKENPEQSSDQKDQKEIQKEDFLLIALYAKEDQEQSIKLIDLKEVQEMISDPKEVLMKEVQDRKEFMKEDLEQFTEQVLQKVIRKKDICPITNREKEEHREMIEIRDQQGQASLTVVPINSEYQRRKPLL